MIYVKSQQPIRDIPFEPVIKPLTIIAGVDQEGGFGKSGKIPWYFPEDLKHFKTVTNNSICIMGRKTYENMLEMVKSRQKKKKKLANVLPNRHSIVLTRQEGYKTEGAVVAGSLSQAVTDLDPGDKREIFIIGGEKLFIESLPFVNKAYLTLIQDTFQCDRFFPIEYLMKHFKITDAKHGKDEKLSFIEYQRTRT